MPELEPSPKMRNLKCNSKSPTGSPFQVRKTFSFGRWSFVTSPVMAPSSTRQNVMSGAVQLSSVLPSKIGLKPESSSAAAPARVSSVRTAAALRCVRIILPPISGPPAQVIPRSVSDEGPREAETRRRPDLSEVKPRRDDTGARRKELSALVHTVRRQLLRELVVVLQLLPQALQFRLQRRHRF